MDGNKKNIEHNYDNEEVVKSAEDDAYDTYDDVDMAFLRFQMSNDNPYTYKNIIELKISKQIAELTKQSKQN